MGRTEFISRAGRGITIHVCLVGRAAALLVAPPLPSPTAGPSPTPRPSPTPIAIPPTPYLLVIQATPLRAGPGAAYETYRLSVVADGFALLGAGADGWWAVRLAGVPGGLAWIDGRAALVYNTAGLPAFVAGARPDVQPIPGKRHLMIVADDVILRSGPGVVFTSVRAAVRGDWFLLAGCSRDGDWLAVSLDGVSTHLGWIRAGAAETY